MEKRAWEHALILQDPDCEYRRGVFLGHAYRRVRAGAWKWVVIARVRCRRVEKVVT